MLLHCCHDEDNFQKGFRPYWGSNLQSLSQRQNWREKKGGWMAADLMGFCVEQNVNYILNTMSYLIQDIRGLQGLE